MREHNALGGGSWKSKFTCVYSVSLPVLVLSDLAFCANSPGSNERREWARDITVFEILSILLILSNSVWEFRNAFDDFCGVAHNDRICGHQVYELNAHSFSPFFLDRIYRIFRI